jgi:hypothetical protein
VPTKFDVAGVGDSGGGKGVPIATATVGGRSIAGSSGCVERDRNRNERNDYEKTNTQQNSELTALMAT